MIRDPFSRPRTVRFPSMREVNIHYKIRGEIRGTQLLQTSWVSSCVIAGHQSGLHTVLQYSDFELIVI